MWYEVICLNCSTVDALGFIVSSSAPITDLDIVVRERPDQLSHEFFFEYMTGRSYCLFSDLLLDKLFDWCRLRNFLICVWITAYQDVALLRWVPTALLIHSRPRLFPIVKIVQHIPDGFALLIVLASNLCACPRTKHRNPSRWCHY